MLWWKLESCFVCICQDVDESSIGADCPASPSPQAEQSHLYLLLLLLPLLTGFLFGTTLEELLGKLLGLRSISKVGSDVVMDLIGRLHFLQEGNKRGNCKKKRDHERVHVDSKHTHANKHQCQISVSNICWSSSLPFPVPHNKDLSCNAGYNWILIYLPDNASMTTRNPQEGSGWQTSQLFQIPPTCYS